MYTTILDAEKSACYRYDSGKQKKTNNGVLYFHVECRYLDFNRQVFDEAVFRLKIRLFQETKSIDRLKTYSLEFYRYLKEIREYFVRYDRRFVFLIDQYHVQYRSNIFFIQKEDYVKVSADSRIIIDVIYFRKINSNYVRLQVNESTLFSSSESFIIF